MNNDPVTARGAEDLKVVEAPVAEDANEHPEWAGKPAGDYILNVSVDTGGEGPVAVLLHGINSDGTDWEPVVAKMPGFRCIAIDMLGWGGSPKPLDVKYSADDHAAAIRATLDQMGVTVPFLLVGYSLGGDVALRYAARFPGHVRRLFLLSAPFYLAPEDFGSRGFSRNFLEQLLYKRLWKFIRRLPARQEKLFDKLISPADRLGQIAQDVIRTDDVDRQWKILALNLTNTISAADFARDLPRIEVPTVFALGVRDPIVRPDQTPQLRRFKPDIEIRRIVGLTADHFMLLNLPETVAAEILRDEIDGLHARMYGGAGAEAPFVFLHGLQSTSRYWEPMAEALASDGHEAVALDLIGFGESPKPLSWRYSVDDHVDMVRRTLVATVGTRAVRLVGHDMGALVAMAYAARFPDAVSGLTLVSPTVFLDDAQRARYPERAFPDGQAAFDRAYGNVAGRLRRAMEEGVVAKTMGEAQQQRAVPVLRSLESVVGKQCVPDRMDDVTAPTRIVYGTRDDMIVPEFIEALARDGGAGGGEVRTVTVDAGHNPPFDAPERTLRIVEPDATDAAVALVAKTSLGFDWRKGSSAIRAILGSTDSTLVIRGVLMLLGGLVLAAFTLAAHLPQRLFVLLFAGFILVWSAQQVLGAVGLRNAKRAWLTFALLGVLGGGLSLYLMLNPALSWSLLLLVIGFLATLTGLSDLYVASRVTRGARPRWVLYLEGGLAVLLAIVVAFGPYHGEAIVGVMAIGYLLVEGTLMLTYAVGTQLLLMRSRTA